MQQGPSALPPLAEMGDDTDSTPREHDAPLRDQGQCARLRAEMSITMKHDSDQRPQSLIGVSFLDSFRAHEFLTAVQGLAAHNHLVLIDAVTVVKSSDGKAIVHETTDPQAFQSAWSGAVWAGLFGLLLGGPVGWVAGAAIGAGAGIATAHFVDLGVSDEWVEWFRESVQPGTSTVVLLVTEVGRNALVEETKRFPGAQLVYTNLDDATVEKIRHSFGDTADAPAGYVAPAVPEPPTLPRRE